MDADSNHFTLPKMDRKTAEKIRRTHMKDLYSKLSSLIPHQHPPKDPDAPNPMLSDQIDEATKYIKSLQEMLEQMEERKKHIRVKGNTRVDDHQCIQTDKATDLAFPQVAVHDLGSILAVVFICNLENQLLLYKSICILEEEGIEVVNANFFNMGEKAFTTLHCKISDSKDDSLTGRVSERLNNLVHEI